MIEDARASFRVVLRVLLALVVVGAMLLTLPPLRIAWEIARRSGPRVEAVVSRAGVAWVCLLGQGVDPGWLFDEERRKKATC